MIKTVWNLILALFCPALIIAIVSASQAAELAGVKFSENIKQGEKGLVLNGLGLREASVFKVDVYVAALYLETKQHSSAAILDSAAEKRLDMRFVRDVSRAKIESAWEDGLKANASDYRSIEPQLRQLNSLMSEMKQGETLSMLFRAEEVEVLRNAKSLGVIKGKSFPRELLSIWLGNSPPNNELKEGLLGVKK